MTQKINPEPPTKLNAKDLKNHVWVTRKSPHVDRLASIWLIRRFIDPKAKFKFVHEPYEAQGKRELLFDMSGGDFTHFGDWCSFETFLHRLTLTDAALKEVAEIIHDIDLKDKKFERPEASGVALSIRGLCELHGNDFERLEEGIRFFDALYASFKKEKEGRR